MNSLNTERKEGTASGKGRKVRHGSTGRTGSDWYG